MIETDSKLLVTYDLPGSTLVKKGSYTPAKIKVIQRQDEEVVVKIAPMKVNAQPVEKKAKISVVLPYDFIQMALETPTFISRRKRMNPLAWKNKSEKERIAIHVNLYCEAMNGSNCVFEIL